MNTSIKKYICNTEDTVENVLGYMDNSQTDVLFVIDKNGLLVGKISRSSLQNSGKNEKITSLFNKDVPFLIDTEIEDENELSNKLKYLQKKFNLSTHDLIPICNSGLRILYVSEVGILVKSKKERGEQLRFADIDRSVRNVCIIGGAGYLGTVLAEKLLNAGYNVTIFDKLIFGIEPVARLKDSIKNKKVGQLELYAGDMRSIPDLMKALKNIDAVVLLGAIVGDPASSKFPVSTFETNYLSVQIISEICAYLNIQRVIYSSTCSVYGQSDTTEPADESSPLNPLSHYARTKIMAEKAILKVDSPNFAPTILRMSTLYGPSFRMRYDLVVNTMMMKGVSANKITIFGGQQWRPLLSVDDAAEAYLKVLKADINKVRRQIYNVGEEQENYQIKDIGFLVYKFLINKGVSVELETIKNEDDLRDYKVSFEKIKTSLGYQTKNTISSTLDQLYDVTVEQFAKNVISSDVFYNDRNNFNSEALGKFVNI